MDELFGVRVAIVFDEAECTCADPPAGHDDGFGCTVPGCECVAGWSWSYE